MTSFVRIALDGVGFFSKMEIRDGDDISDLKVRACAEFPSWKADSAQLALYLVAAGGDDEPAAEVISAVLSNGGRLGAGWSLTRAEIFSGAWLVARKAEDGIAVVAAAQLGGASSFLHLALQATHYRLTAVVLRVGNSLFSAASGMEDVGVPSSRRATHESSRVLDGQQEHDSTMGVHLPRRMLNFGMDSGESEGGALKEE